MRICLIGYGNIAKKHIETFRSLGAEIVASCNRSVFKNKLASEESLIPRTYTNYIEMIRDVKPDGIIVCASFWNMFEILKDIIPFQIPILSEKPSAITFNEHIELINLTEKHSTPVMIAMNRRHYEVIEKGIALMGGLQNINQVLIEWSEDPQNLVSNRKLSNEQILNYTFANTIHGIDLLNYLSSGIDDYGLNFISRGGSYNFQYNVSGVSSSNCLFNFNCSWFSPVPWRVVICGHEKRVVYAPLERGEYTFRKEKEAIEATNEDIVFKPGFYKQSQNFINGNFEKDSLISVITPMKICQAITEKMKLVPHQI